ncbi:MAG TPA: SoxR reducing system RseC family protein [Bacteroidales bacterium]|nr:SoxR reducing system RseC family protein [Bacteroidales bacterium]
MKNSTDPLTINHSGVVLKVNDKSVSVIISAASACSGCQAEGSCNMSGKEEKIIDVAGSYNLKPGDDVTILMRQSMGYTALFLGYIFPLITVIIVLLTLVSMKIPELIAGVTSLAILIPYYIILIFFRKRINEKFTFTLKA